MHKTAFAAIMVLLAALAAFAADQGFVTLQNITGYSIGTKGFQYAKNVSGPVVIKPDAACKVFLNATTLTRTASATGYPMSANTDYPFSVPISAKISFTCTSTASAKTVYIAR